MATTNLRIYIYFFILDGTTTTTERHRLFDRPSIQTSHRDTVGGNGGGGGLSINLQFEQESTTRRPSLFSFDPDSTTRRPNIFRLPNAEDSIDVGPSESPRSFDSSRFFKNNVNSEPSRHNRFNKLNKAKHNIFGGGQKEDNKKEVLNDIINILDVDENDETPTSNKNVERPRVVINEKRLPFTVVRVSSSVSQVRDQEQDVNDEENDIKLSGKIESVTKGEPENNDIFSFAKTTLEPQVSETTSKKPDFRKHENRKKTGERTGSRPPFLKPLAKFPDIRIPSLDKERKDKENIKRINKFNFRPRKPSVLSALRTTTDSTSASTTDEDLTTTSRLTRIEIPERKSTTTTPNETTESTTRGLFQGLQGFDGLQGFNFATRDDAESVSIKSLIDLIPKVKDTDEETSTSYTFIDQTSSTQSLINLIPGVRKDSGEQFSSNDKNNKNVVSIGNAAEVNTLRASLEIVPIKSTTDRNAPNRVVIGENTNSVANEDDDDGSGDSETRPTAGIPGSNRDLEIIPIPPRPSPHGPPLSSVVPETTTTSREPTTTLRTVPTTKSRGTTKKLSLLQQIVQRRRTTSAATGESTTTRTTSTLLERARSRDSFRPTITVDVRFRDRPNPTAISRLPPATTEPSSENDIEGSDQIATTTQTAEAQEDVTTQATEQKVEESPRPTIGGGGR